MLLGLVLPVVQLTARFDPPAWEVTAGPDALLTITHRAEAAGYDFVCCPEHVCIPAEIASWRGGRYFDPLSTLSFLAAGTDSIRLLTHTVVLGLHHPLALIKSYSTLDWLSGGRLVLGVGVGNLRQEFELVGATFDNRGSLADDALLGIRASMGEVQPVYEGPHFAWSGVVIDPAAVQAPPPIWVGGRTLRSLRRATTLGEGWIPFGLGLSELSAMLSSAAARRLLDEAERPIEIVLAPEPPLDPLGDPDELRRTADAYLAAGATGLNLRFVHTSLEHYLDQAEAASELLAPEQSRRSLRK